MWINKQKTNKNKNETILWRKSYLQYLNDNVFHYEWAVFGFYEIFVVRIAAVANVDDDGGDIAVDENFGVDTTAGNVDYSNDDYYSIP